MQTNATAEQIVKDRWPDAVCQCGHMFGFPIYYYIENSLTGDTLSKWEPEPTEAWENAAERVRKEGK